MFKLRALGRIGAVLALVIGLGLPVCGLAASVDTGHVKAELIVSGEAVPNIDLLNFNKKIYKGCGIYTFKKK